MRYLAIISLNIISGISLATLIVIGVTYLSFKNTNVFQDVKIEIVNNPVSGHDDIEFHMMGFKPYECNSTTVYGVAYAADGTHSHELNTFTKQYTRNTRPGEPVPNAWTMERPADMQAGGRYFVTMTGEFICNHWAFKVPKVQSYHGILLDALPVDN